ncbi:MAG: prolyl oligopeptidase family serine peptidase [Kofleriaceae bacterium]
MNGWTLVVLCAAAVTAHADTPNRGATRIAPPPPPPGYNGLGAGSVSPADVAKYAAQPLDGAVSRRIETLLDVRGASSGHITQAGNRMVFSWRITGTSQVWRQDGPMKLPVQLTGGEDRTSVVGISPDDTVVVVSRDVGGEENPGLYVLDPAGGPLKVVQHTPKVQTSLQFVSDDSKSLYFRANDITPSSYAIYRYDLKAGTKQLVFDQPGLWSISDHQGDSWLLTKALGNTQVEIYRYDVASKALTPLLGQNEVEQYAVAFGAKPNQVLVRTNKLGDFHRLYSFDGKTLTPITPAVSHDVQSFAIDRARQRIYYTVNEHGYSKLYVIDAKTHRPLALPKLPDAENISLTGLSYNGRFAQLSIDGSTMPSQTVSFDWRTRKATTWRLPSTPEVDVKRFAKATLEYYPARDGTKIPMFVRRPASCTGPCPVVVDFHGGPESQARPGFSTTAQLYVDAGFIYVEPNVRGSAGYGKTWLHADDGPKRLAVITDIADCARFIRATWTKDGKPPRIGVTGGSYGGYSTLMAMTYLAGAYDVGVAEYSISNLTTFLINTAPYRRILRISEYGDPVKDAAALAQLSPITHVAKLNAPLLLIQGVNDPRTPVGEAMQIYAELARRKIPSGLILFADEGHGASKRSNIVLQLGHAIAFFEKHLKR